MQSKVLAELQSASFSWEFKFVLKKDIKSSIFQQGQNLVQRPYKQLILKHSLQIFFSNFNHIILPYLFNILKKKYDQQNNMSIQTLNQSHIITDNFIKQLFQHPLFQQQLKTTLHLPKNIKDQHKNNVEPIIEDIVCLMWNEVNKGIQNKIKNAQQQIQSMKMEVERMKEQHYSLSSKAENLTKQASQSLLFEDEQIFELPSVHRTLNLQEKLRESVSNSSALWQGSEILKQSRVQQCFQQKISSQIGKLQQSFLHQQDKLEELINKKIEKQQKTINNILETLNQLHSVPKSDKDKVPATLSQSKSAVKLKNFFGFG